MQKTISIIGGSGFLGRKLSEHLISKGYSVRILSRRKIKGNPPAEYHTYSNSGDIARLIENNAAVINLSGASIAGKRWTEEYKKEMYDSRINTTRMTVDAIGKCQVKPLCFINASATGVYGNCGNDILTEKSPTGNDFLADMCKDWESEALKAKQINVRTVVMRTGVVLDKDEAALKKMVPPFKFFVGGKLGNGKQWFPWIHIDDLVSLFLFAIENSGISDALIASAPHPVTNAQFSKSLGRVLHRPSFIPVPYFALRIALGEFAKFLVSSQRTIPSKAEEYGFGFKFKDIDTALKDIFPK